MAFKPVYFSFSGVSITPQGGSAILLKETTRLRIIRRENLEEWQGSGDQFSTLFAVSKSDRGCSIEGADINLHLTIPANTACAITGTILHPKNGTGEGALTFTLANAVLQDSSFGAESRRFAGGGVEFLAYSSDGTTDPMTFAVAPAPGG